MQLPKGKNLYDILDLTKEQVENDESTVKKAYRKLALKYHPDKQVSNSAEQVEQATQQFLLVGYAYSILNDSGKRRHYDLTGGHQDMDSFFSGSKDWTNYFKQQWDGVVSGETIDAHAAKYKGSTEEEENVLKYYTQFKGNMNHILAHVEHSKAADVTRFMDLIQAAIENNEVDTFPAYAKTTTKAAQLRRVKREEEEKARVEKEALKKKAAKDNKGKLEGGDFGNNSEDIESSEVEEETDDDVDDDSNDDEDTTLESLEDKIRARQQQRASKFDEMVANMEKAAEAKKKGRTVKAQGVINKKKGKGRATEIDSTDEDSLSANSSKEPASTESTSPSSVSNSDATSTLSTPSSKDEKHKGTSTKERQTTINTRSTTKKRTQETRTKTTNEDTDADATTTTTSVVSKSKKITTKVDQKKRKRGGHQDDDDNDNSTVATTKKTKKVSPSNGGKTGFSAKSLLQRRPRRPQATKNTRSANVQ